MTAYPPPLGGVIPIVPTPFDGDGTLDLPALDRVLGYLRSVGVHGVAVLGMASEAITLTDSERELVVARTGRAGLGVPVVAGCSAQSPQAVAQLAAALQGEGADVLMVMPPSMGAPGFDQLKAYFFAAADAVEIPIMIQDNPGWTGTTLSPELYSSLAGHPGIRYAKVETAHPPTTMRAVQAVIGDSLVLFGGQAGNWLPEELDRGVAGTMPAAIMPQVYLRVLELWSSGDHQEALRTFDHFHPLIRVTGQPRTGIPMAKQLLVDAGVLPGAAVRGPFQPLSALDRTDLDRVVERLEILGIMRGEIEVAAVVSRPAQSIS